MTLRIVPSGGRLTADVFGVDLSAPLSAETAAILFEAWMEHLVLRFPGQRLDDAALMRFSRLFGELDRTPGYTPNSGGDPNGEWVTVISNIVVDDRPLGGLGYGEAAWHTDMSYNPVPPRASALYALEIPPAGGDTSFINMYAAFEDLPAATRGRIDSLDCIHDSSRDSTGALRGGVIETDDPRQTPGARHPLVRLHPVTLRPCLFLGRRKGAYIPGLSLVQSEALLDELWAHATQERYVWTQQWTVGDLLLWDNRCTMHRRESFDPAARRLMHRTQMVGEAVIAQPGTSAVRTTYAVGE